MARELGPVGLVMSLLVAGCVAVPPEVTVTETVDGPSPGSGPGAQMPPPPNGGPHPGTPTGSGMMGSQNPPGSGGMSAPSGTGTSGGSGTASTGTGVKYSVPRALHEATWLCQTPIAVDDARPAGTDNQECNVSLSFTSTQVTVMSSGIPNHDYDSGGGCCAKVQSLTNSFPLVPEMATAASYSSTRGAIAIAVNGVAMFGPEDSNDQDVMIATYTDPNVEPRLEMCDAHSEPNSGTYHYHGDANCIHWHPGAGQTWDDYDFTKVDTTTHSKIVGFAKDGFPIYGSYGYVAGMTTIKEITSSYRLKAGATGANGIADQEYVAGLGDLDECNGRFGKTPEFPDGIYHYYSTKKNGEGGWGFPYFPLCYKGVVSATTSGGGMTGPGTSSPSGNGGMPPPPGGTGGMPPPPPPGGG